MSTRVITLQFVRLQLKLRKIGNSLGVVLPKEALTHLQASEGDVLSVTESTDGALRISPAQPEVSRQMAAVQDIMERYRNTLRELAR